MKSLEVLSVLFFIIGIILFGKAYHNIDLSLWSATTGFEDVNLFRVQDAKDLYMGGMLMWFLGVLSIFTSYIILLVYIITIKQ